MEVPWGLLDSTVSMFVPLEKTFTSLLEEKSWLVNATVVNCWVFKGQASVGGFKVHFITAGSQRKSLCGTTAFRGALVDTGGVGRTRDSMTLRAW